MITYKVRNTNGATLRIIKDIVQYGSKENSRNGTVYAFKEPVSIEYAEPLERVNVIPERDANPFFHLEESMWMLAGRRSVAPIGWMIENINNYADNGKIMAAYGYRAISRYRFNQLKEVRKKLDADISDRQCHVQLWDADQDLITDHKDKACNTSMDFRYVDGRINMTVYNRSNDAIWGGVSGANVVHFPFFLEYVCGTEYIPGTITVVSNNLHVYVDNKKLPSILGIEYDYNDIVPYMNNLSLFYGSDEDKFYSSIEDYYTIEPQKRNVTKCFFLNEVCIPMLITYRIYKEAGPEKALDYLIKNVNVRIDWTYAAIKWLSRRVR